MTTVQKSNRLDLFDLLKGIAIVTMVGLHYLYLATFLGSLDETIVSSFPYFLVSRIVACSFVILSTIVLWYQSARTSANKVWFPKLAKQVVKLGLSAVLVSVATYFWLDDGYVRFGILHLLTAATLVNGLLFRTKIAKVAYVIAGVSTIILGNWLLRQQLGISGWEWLGLVPNNFTSIDYVPVLPWLGLTWLAAAFAPVAITYATAVQSRIAAHFQWLLWCGRHTLAIYLLHIPVAMGALWLLERFL